MGYYYHAQWSNPEWKSGKLSDRSSDWHYFSFVLQIIETKAKCLTNRAIICKKYRVPPYGLLTAKCWGEAISSIYLVWDEKIFYLFFPFLGNSFNSNCSCPLFLISHFFPSPKRHEHTTLNSGFHVALLLFINVLLSA